MPLYLPHAGSAIVVAYLNTGQGFVSSGYTGIGADGSSTINTNVTPFVAPCAGVLRNLRVFGLSNTSGTCVVTIYKATASTNPAYASTALTATVANGTQTASDTSHVVAVNAGDLIVAFTSASWSANGATVSCQFIPNG